MWELISLRYVSMFSVIQVIIIHDVKYAYNFQSVTFGCEAWSLKLREEHKLRVKKIFEPKRQEVA
jgi:hypothetical protein